MQYPAKSTTEAQLATEKAQYKGANLEIGNLRPELAEIEKALAASRPAYMALQKKHDEITAKIAKLEALAVQSENKIFRLETILGGLEG
jgi:uncharacterized protein involved in exopolysaccharide biosynthesis